MILLALLDGAIPVKFLGPVSERGRITADEHKMRKNRRGVMPTASPASNNEEATDSCDAMSTLRYGDSKRRAVLYELRGSVRPYGRCRRPSSGCAITGTDLAAMGHRPSRSGTGHPLGVRAWRFGTSPLREAGAGLFPQELWSCSRQFAASSKDPRKHGSDAFCATGR